MSNLLFDTNVLLDSLMLGRPQCHEARALLTRCNGEGDKGFMVAHSLSDVAYILGRRLGKEASRNALKQLMGMLIIAPLTAEHCEKAFLDGEADFEDGLIRAAAELEDMDYIITRDKDAFAESKVPHVTAAEYLEIAREKDENWRE